ncbi:DUF3305 domain-containing protein [Azospirillum canadense]|uniref:DUF3305 domain-containing protein n=1 Tax=Azospirillum canadense TaxID=403962 RepID=UPI00222799B2|nr:DUF3305 domain-containing protein [Azospirillum canadense]MCW2236083.1 hypothetical protein [Azospirillum canadense]
MSDALNRIETMPLGIVLERRRSASPWAEWAWHPVSVIPGAPPVEGAWRLLREGEGWAQFHAATLPLELFRTDTEGYKLNLSQEPPRLWVVLRADEGGESGAVVPFVVTASAHECEGYQVSGAEIVETVPMPDEVIALLRDFTEQHHVDVPFVKRERKRHFPKGE